MNAEYLRKKNSQLLWCDLATVFHQVHLKCKNEQKKRLLQLRHQVKKDPELGCNCHGQMLIVAWPHGTSGGPTNARCLEM